METEVYKLGQPFYKRIVLKLSGEALAGQQGYGIDSEVITSIAEQVKDVVELNVEVAIVVAAGIFGVVLQVVRKVWIVQQRIIWVCLLLS